MRSSCDARICQSRSSISRYPWEEPLRRRLHLDVLRALGRSRWQLSVALPRHVCARLAVVTAPVLKQTQLGLVVGRLLARGSEVEPGGSCGCLDNNMHPSVKFDEDDGALFLFRAVIGGKGGSWRL